MQLAVDSVEQERPGDDVMLDPNPIESTLVEQLEASSDEHEEATTDDDDDVLVSEQLLSLLLVREDGQSSEESRTEHGDDEILEMLSTLGNEPDHRDLWCLPFFFLCAPWPASSQESQCFLSLFFLLCFFSVAVCPSFFFSECAVPARGRTQTPSLSQPGSNTPSPKGSTSAISAGVL